MGGSLITIIILDKKGNMLVFCPESYDLYLSFKWHVPNIRNSNKPYLRRSYKGRTILFHREILSSISESVDHINGDSLDNRKINLRNCSSKENHLSRKAKKNSSSRFVGVSRHSDGRGWNAYVTRYGIRHYVGYFSSEEEAAKSRDIAASKILGSFYIPNFS
jgi:hypothetical protein